MIRKRRLTPMPGSDAKLIERLALADQAEWAAMFAQSTRTRLPIAAIVSAAALAIVAVALLVTK